MENELKNLELSSSLFHAKLTTFFLNGFESSILCIWSRFDLGARDLTLFAAFIFSNSSKCRRFTFKVENFRKNKHTKSFKIFHLSQKFRARSLLSSYINMF